VIALPVICSVISLLCASVVFRDARRKPRPDKVAWSIAFLMFALAAGADAAGRAIEWTPWLARLYYATGPALVVAYLAIGQLYLLFPRAMARYGAGGTLLITALWITMVASAPIDRSRLAEDGWEAIDRGPEMVALTVAINATGTLIIVGGTGYSVWRFRKRGTQRNRMIGCALISTGTLVVAAGGSLTRLGHYEYLYIAMAAGVSLIYAGVLMSRKPDRVSQAIGARAVPTHPEPSVATVVEPESLAASQAPATPAISPALAYIQGVVLRLPDDELDRLCTEWSVPRDDAPSLTRFDARRAWRLRTTLAPPHASMFDTHGVQARRQVTSLYHDVLNVERSHPDDITELVSASDPASRAKHVEKTG